MANQYTTGGYTTVLYTAASAKKARRRKPGRARMRHASFSTFTTRYREGRRWGRRELRDFGVGALAEVYVLDGKGRPRLLEQHRVVEHQGTRGPYRRVVQEER